MKRSEEERRQRQREERSRRRPSDGWRYDEDDRRPRGAYEEDGWEDVRAEIRGSFADDFSPGYREGESWEDRPHIPEDDRPRTADTAARPRRAAGGDAAAAC